MRYFFALCMALGMSCSAFAQRTIIDELQTNRVGQGQVTIHQDPKIAALLGIIYQRNPESAEPTTLKARGYRVQVYAGNNSRVARNEAHKVAERIKQEFPEFPVYAFFLPPRWLCRVGDFRSIEEADASMRRLKAAGDFKEVSIVREQINISLE